ncbi:unnamed protein product [Blepharisma stoltei]|uniref:Uncharacterized protein n=1 Tax=Blepharisma stoltei TaxID=1481888 RepID=A0AAU9IKV8_9CILI|nr:unnamed protein product [Blepharisma stoltei]
MKTNSLQVSGYGLKTDFSDKISIDPNLAILRHPNLDFNPTFIFLKEELQKFYRDRRRPFDRQIMHRTHSSNWKERFFTSLQTLLSELTFTEDLELQSKMLEKVENWYNNKIVREESIEEEINLEPKTPVLRVKPKLETSLLVPLRSESMSPQRKSTVPYIPKKLPSLIKSYEKPLEFKKRLQTSFKNTRNEKKEALLPTEIKALNGDETVSTKIERIARLRPATQQERPFTETSPLVMTSRGEFVMTKSNKANVFDFRATDKTRSTVASPEQSPLGSSVNKARVSAFSFREMDSVFKTQIVSPSINDEEIANSYQPISPLNKSVIEQLGEILHVKNRLAARKVSCPYRVLERALYDRELDFNKSFDPSQLPKGNERLLKNPAYKEEKPKKKGKKKGKKKKSGS